uniref:Uncharacterized protein n=1 Tax=Rhizophora mucronata TaxID=61149 RepID=A0A2P2Q250_RHIMU
MTKYRLEIVHTQISAQLSRIH